MTYKRVLPRDIFNEANLLKCIGKLTLMIEDGLILWLSYHYDGEPFVVCMHECDGSLYVANIQFIAHNKTLDVRRPLNSREAWPLFINADDCIDVFNDDGEFILNELDLANALNM